jgi:hypothetical protein
VNYSSILPTDRHKYKQKGNNMNTEDATFLRDNIEEALGWVEKEAPSNIGRCIHLLSIFASGESASAKKFIALTKKQNGIMAEQGELLQSQSINFTKQQENVDALLEHITKAGKAEALQTSMQGLLESFQETLSSIKAEIPLKEGGTDAPT